MEYQNLKFKYIEKPELPDELNEGDIELMVSELNFLEEQARKKELTKRWYALGEKRKEIYKCLGLYCSKNPDEEILNNYIIDNPNGEEIIARLEVIKANYDAAESVYCNSYYFKRRKAYNEAGLTPDKLIVDLWELIVEQRDIEAMKSQAIRKIIKNLYPKE